MDRDTTDPMFVEGLWRTYLLPTFLVIAQSVVDQSNVYRIELHLPSEHDAVVDPPPVGFVANREGQKALSPGGG